MVVTPPAYEQKSKLVAHSLSRLYITASGTEPDGANIQTHRARIRTYHRVYTRLFENRDMGRSCSGTFAGPFGGHFLQDEQTGIPSNHGSKPVNMVEP